MIGYIKPDGSLLKSNRPNACHRDLEIKNKLQKSYLTTAVKKLNYIRINDGSRLGYEFECLAELPEKITNEQIEALLNGLDEISYYKEFITTEINIKHDYHSANVKPEADFYKQYYFKDITTDKIIKEITNYYSKF